MAGITQAQAQAMLDALIAAVPDTSGALAVSVGGKTVTYRSMEEINKAIDFWDARVKKLSRGGIRVRGVVPI